MTEVLTKTKGMAQIGSKVESKKGIVGIVELVRENSVIVKIIETPPHLEFENDRTVINHKNYKIV